jgi:hypothetical protein
MEAAAPFIAMDIEQALLGAILCDSGVLDRIEGQLVVDDFSEARHRRLFEIFVDAHQAGHRIDYRLAIATLGPDAATQITPELTIAQYVARLAAEAVDIRSAKSYARSIRDLADKRRLVDIALRYEKADCWTPPFIWQPIGLPPNRREAFGVIKILLEYPLGGSASYDGWIVLPEGHPFSYNGSGAEVISKTRVPGVAYGKSCAIILTHSPSEPRPSTFGKNFGL